MTPGAEPARASSPSFLAERVPLYQQRIESVLARALEIEGGATARLLEAMRYSTLGGGKRVRPVLVYATGEALGATLEQLDCAAASVEIIHVYSLVHDDLPAMDNDDLRRGRPTCHRAFDEATAILVGDALQALAFEVLANGPATLAPGARLEMLRVLANAIGTRGMAGGQAIDLESVKQSLGEPALGRMHRQKNGALIQASVLLGAFRRACRKPPRAARWHLWCGNRPRPSESGRHPRRGRHLPVLGNAAARNPTAESKFSFRASNGTIPRHGAGPPEPPIPALGPLGPDSAFWRFPISGAPPNKYFSPGVRGNR